MSWATHVLGNPLKYTDLSGHCAGDPSDTQNADYECWQQIYLIEGQYSNVSIDPKLWTLDELMILSEALAGVLATFNNEVDHFVAALGKVRFIRQRANGQLAAGYKIFSGNLEVYDLAFQSPWSSNDFSNEEWARYAIAHELGHAFDFGDTYKNGLGSWLHPNRSFAFLGMWPDCIVAIYGRCGGGTTGTTASDYGNTNSVEDFAETFVVTVSGTNGWRLPPDRRAPDSQRRETLNALIALAVSD